MARDAQSKELKKAKTTDKDFTPVTYDPQYLLMVNNLKKYFPSRVAWGRSKGS